jgi:hypothetical protein
MHTDDFNCFTSHHQLIPCKHSRSTPFSGGSTIIGNLDIAPNFSGAGYIILHTLQLVSLSMTLPSHVMSRSWRHSDANDRLKIADVTAFKQLIAPEFIQKLHAGPLTRLPLISHAIIMDHHSSFKAH